MGLHGLEQVMESWREVGEKELQKRLVREIQPDAAVLIDLKSEGHPAERSTRSSADPLPAFSATSPTAHSQNVSRAARGRSREMSFFPAAA